MSKLTENELFNLTDEAEDLWLWMEEYRIGHKELYLRESRNSKILKITALVASIATILSTTPMLNMISYFTEIAAILTACATGLTQLINPEKKQREHWDAVKLIETSQKGLTSKARSFYHIVDFENEQLNLKRLHTNINLILTKDINITAKHKKQALEAFELVRFKPSNQTDNYGVLNIEEGMLDDGDFDLPKRVSRVKSL